MEIIFPEHMAERKAPCNLNEADRPLFEHEFRKRIRETHLLRLRDCTILNDLILKGSDPWKYMTYSQIHTLTFRDVVKRMLKVPPPSKRFENGVWVTDNWSMGYFHWLTDALPRLLASERSDRGIPVLLQKHYENLPFVGGSLQLLGRKALYYDPTRKLRVEHLLLPSHTASTGNYNAVLINELCDRMLHPADTAVERRIYISRQKAKKRRVLNETEVISKLEQFGFEIHCFEDHSFAEQVHLMAGAKCVVGMHGAGLTNMLFMPPKGKVLEFRNRADAQNNCYFSLASDLGHHYYYQICQGNTDDTHVVDIQVDMQELERDLQTMLD